MSQAPVGNRREELLQSRQGVGRGTKKGSAPYRHPDEEREGLGSQESSHEAVPYRGSCRLREQGGSCNTKKVGDGKDMEKQE